MSFLLALPLLPFAAPLPAAAAAALPYEGLTELDPVADDIHDPLCLAYAGGVLAGVGTALLVSILVTGNVGDGVALPPAKRILPCCDLRDKKEEVRPDVRSERLIERGALGRWIDPGLEERRVAEDLAEVRCLCVVVRGVGWLGVVEVEEEVEVEAKEEEGARGCREGRCCCCCCC